MQKKKIGIIGATGFTGSELIRLLLNHDSVEIMFITSESQTGKHISEVHGFFEGIADIRLQSANDVDYDSVDLVFLALPHGTSMHYIKRMAGSSCKIVDLSGDYRLDGPEVYEEWYQKKHVYPEAFDRSAYGLPEINRSYIEQSDLIANPGCYPTSSILALAPLMVSTSFDVESIIIDAKSGVTGAGIKSKPVNLFSNVNDNFKSYGLKSHRHSIEIQQIVSALNKSDVSIQFTPHLLPLDRGILSTIYIANKSGLHQEALDTIYRNFYGDAPFIRLRSTAPEIKDVRGTNYCDIYATVDERTNNIIVISVIDNLIKGAAGQAIQNMNILLGFNQDKGLLMNPLRP